MPIITVAAQCSPTLPDPRKRGPSCCAPALPARSEARRIAIAYSQAERQSRPPAKPAPVRVSTRKAHLRQAPLPNPLPQSGRGSDRPFSLWEKVWMRVWAPRRIATACDLRRPPCIWAFLVETRSLKDLFRGSLAGDPSCSSLPRPATSAVGLSLARAGRSQPRYRVRSANNGDRAAATDQSAHYGQLDARRSLTQESGSSALNLMTSRGMPQG